MSIAILLHYSSKSEICQAADADCLGYFVALRHMDATPILVRFGRLQSLLAPGARYMIRREVMGRPCWVAVSLDEYRSIFRKPPSHLPWYGRVEVIGHMHSLLTTIKRAGEAPELVNLRLPLPPQISERGNSSCILRGLETVSRVLSRPGITKLAGKVVCGLVYTVPDMHPANIRAMACFKENLPDNVFDVVYAICFEQGTLVGSC